MSFDDPFDADRSLQKGGCSCGGHSQPGRARNGGPWHRPMLAPRASSSRRWCARCSPRIARAAPSCARSAPPRRWPPSRSSSRSARPRRRSPKPPRPRRKTSRSASSPSPAPRPSSWRTRWASIPSTASTWRWSRPPAGPSSATRRSTRNTTPRTCSRPCRSPSRWASGSNPIPYTMPAVENINGQAITLAVKHKDKRDPKTWKGFKFAVPFDYSMHNYLLRYYVAEHGIDPDTDIQIRAVPPPEMVANLRADNIDGFLGPDPVQPARRLRRRRLHPHAVEGDVGGASLLRLRGVEGVRHHHAEHLRRAAQVDHRCHRVCRQAREPQADRRRRSRPPTTSTSR